MAYAAAWPLGNPYPAKGAMVSQRAEISSSLYPFSRARELNFSCCSAIREPIFLPIALRRTSASPQVNPAISRTIIRT